MTAYEYILNKYGKGRTRVIILNALEARIFGIQYPLKKGWIAKAKKLQVTKNMLDELSEKLPAYVALQRKKSEKKKKSSCVTIVEYTENKAFFTDPKSDLFLKSFEWRRLRLKVIKKYGAVCMCCGASPATGAVINVDHIKPRKFFPELALEETNLQILCHDCNHGKGNWDQTDWRPAEQENVFDPVKECLDRMRLG